MRVNYFSSDEVLGEPGFLAEYRATVDRLHSETVAELGGQPMTPEKASMIAIALACPLLAALMLPAVPLEPHVWQVLMVVVVIWGAVFRIQSWRYERFLARWHGKLAAHDAGAGNAR